MFYYALDCGSTIYCGKTRDLQIRLMQHADGKGSKYTQLRSYKKALCWAEVEKPERDTEEQFARYVYTVYNKPCTIGHGALKRSMYPRFTLNSFDEWNGLRSEEVPY